MEGSCHLPLKYFYHVPNICHGLVKVQFQIFYAAKNGGRFLQESTVCAELRNVNSFTQSKNLKLNFTPRKARKSRQFWYLSQTKLTNAKFFRKKTFEGSPALPVDPIKLALASSVSSPEASPIPIPASFSRHFQHT